ncbi:hypothetical protein LUZ60_014019 [Juncus effusus]|nr:hypothetical protein LUZ60_014019 [Juncus effusus]
MAMAMAKRRKWAVEACTNSPMSSLDDGCLMHIFSFLPPIPDRYNTALVSKRWRILACHPRLWLRVERPLKNSCQPGVFPTLEAAVSAARPGDTILIAAGETHIACNVQIKKPLCFMGGGKHPDETLLTCSRGFDSALEFESNCKISNLTIRTELGCCLHHRSGKLTIEGCILQCEENPLDYLSFPIMSTAPKSSSSQLKEKEKEKVNGHGPHGVSVVRTRLEGGAKAVCVNGELVLNHVRAIYSRASILFWFEVSEK